MMLVPVLLITSFMVSQPAIKAGEQNGSMKKSPFLGLLSVSGCHRFQFFRFAAAKPDCLYQQCRYFPADNGHDCLGCGNQYRQIPEGRSKALCPCLDSLYMADSRRILSGEIYGAYIYVKQSVITYKQKIINHFISGIFYMYLLRLGWGTCESLPPFSTKKRPAFIPAIFILELSKQPDKEQIYIHISPYKENNIKHICVISPSNKTTNKYAL